MPELRTPNLTKADYEAPTTFRRVLRQFTAFSEQAAPQAGLTPQQHQALLAIKGSACTALWNWWTGWLNSDWSSGERTRSITAVCVSRLHRMPRLC